MAEGLASSGAEVRVWFLADADVWLWSWDLVDPETGEVLERGWDSWWLAYASAEEARRAGLRRLEGRSGGGGPAVVSGPRSLVRAPRDQRLSA